LQYDHCSRIGDNQLFCDCHLSWLAGWLRTHPTLALFTKCAGPPALRNAEIAELEEADFRCDQDVAAASPMLADAAYVSPSQDCVIPQVCPNQCVCTDTIVDCRNKGLTEIPPNIPDGTTEL
jgi:hypothetical protein